MPRFTIGIPTYNRSHMLPRAIDAALAQTHDDVEVIVSDNASTDDTAEVVRAYGDRVRYYRNSENIGAWPNFARLPELATGEYFSWFTDDDLIHCDFARKAVAGLSGSPDNVAYFTYHVWTNSLKTIRHMQVGGPIFQLDLTGKKPRVVDGLLMYPLSLFYSVVTMPAVAFRTHAVKSAVKHIIKGFDYYNENIVFSESCSHGNVVIDPWIGAYFHFNEDSYSGKTAGNIERWNHEWKISANAMAERLAKLDDRWKRGLRDCLANEFRTEDIVQYLTCQGIPRTEAAWDGVHPLILEVRRMMMEVLPPETIRTLTQDSINQSAQPENYAWPRIKRIARQVTPPVLWNALRHAKKSKKQAKTEK